MCDGYLKQPDSILHPNQNTTHLHTSGHTTHKAITDVCNTVCPTQTIIPIHTINFAKLDDLGLTYQIEHLSDGQVYKVKQGAVFINIINTQLSLGFFVYGRLTNWGCLTIGYHNISCIGFSLKVSYTNSAPQIGTNKVKMHRAISKALDIRAF